MEDHKCLTDLIDGGVREIKNCGVLLNGGHRLSTSFILRLKTYLKHPQVQESLRNNFNG